MFDHAAMVNSNLVHTNPFESSSLI
jgi:hypothetical protein